VRPNARSSYLPAINRASIINRSEEGTNAVPRAAPCYSTLAPGESVDASAASPLLLRFGISSINSTEVPARVTRPRSYTPSAAHIRLAKERASEARDDSAAGNYLLAIATGKQTRVVITRNAVVARDCDRFPSSTYPVNCAARSERAIE